MASTSKSKDPPRHFLLGTTPTEDDKVLTGARLPTERQVLLCFLAHHSGSNTVRDAANITVDAVLPFYHKARIPTLADTKMAEEIIKLFTQMKDLLKISTAKRTTETNQKKFETFKEKLDKTMKFWPRNALEKIGIEEDRLFLLSMMGDRKAVMAGTDAVLSTTEKKVYARKVSEEQRKAKENARKMTTDQSKEDHIPDQDQYQDEEELSGDQGEPEQLPKRSHKRVVKTGTSAFWPHDVLRHPDIVETATRNKISATQLSAVAHSFITATSGDPTKVNLHYKTAYNYKTEVTNSIVKEIKSTWSPPDIGLIHWDGKLMDTLDTDYGVQERLPILLSGIGGVKLLGVPALAHKSTERSGPQLAAATKGLLDEWGCANTVAGMVFDTTSANTGAITAGCISVQSILERELLWFACRHHMGEVLLTHVWNSLQIEVSKSPDIMLFTRFKENFECLAYSKIEDLDIPQTSPLAFRECRETIIKLCNESLKKDLVRGDYRELVKLTLLYLNEENFSFSGLIKPGALHKARWMAKILYSIKIVLLQRQIATLPKGTITTPSQTGKLKRFVQFIVYCYVPWWLTAPVPAAAPSNDVLLINTLLKYKQVDDVAASAALKAFKGHLWYLTHELVPLSLFSSAVDNETKSELVLEMKKHPVSNKLNQRHGTDFGKPVFPELPDEETKLTSFVGEDSWGFFRILKLDTTFLDSPVSDWPLSVPYLDALKIVLNLCVVNDSAERGVKLCHDFIDSARKEGNLQNILQVVENNRNKLPDQRKRKLVSKNWYLSS